MTTTTTTSTTSTTTTSATRSAPAPSRGDRAPGRRTSRLGRGGRGAVLLLLGLPLGVTAATVVVTCAAVGAATLPVALIGIPVLCGLWYAVRALANIERAAAALLLDVHLPMVPWSDPGRGTPWARLRRMSADRLRRRELAYLLLRVPVGVVTSAAAVTALTVPAAVATAPAVARWGDADPFGHHGLGAWLEDVASTPWAWSCVPVAVLLLVGAAHLLDLAAQRCARWAARWLDPGPA